MVVSLEWTLAQLAGLVGQQSAEASAALLLAQTRQFIANEGLGVVLPGTAWVVASDAPAAVRAEALAAKRNLGDLVQICDGTADEVEIQAAIDALGTGKVVLSGGAFSLATAVNLASNLYIEGQGIGATVLNYVEDTDGVHMFNASGISQFGIRNMEMGGSGAARCRAINIISGCSDGLFENLYIHNFTGTSDNAGGVVQIVSGNHIRFVHVFVKDSYKAAGTLRSRGFQAYAATDCEWINCRAEGNGYEGMFLSGSSDNALIVGFDAYDNGVANDGAEVNVAILDCDGVQVIGMKGRGYASSGYGEQNLELNTCTNSLVLGGFFTAATWDGIHILGCHHCLVEGVNCYGNLRCGIDVTADNAIQGTYNVFAGNSCVDNAVDGIRLSNGYGSGNDDALIQGNICTGNANYGILITADNNRTVVKGNQLRGNTTGALADAGAGTVAEGNHGSLIDGLIADPGDGNAIPITVSGHVPLVTGGGGETRSLADAAAPGLTLDLYFKTDGSDCVVTAASPINQNGDTVMTFSDVGEHIRLISIEDGADYEWRVVANDGVALA